MTLDATTAMDLALAELPRPHGQLRPDDGSVRLWWSHDRGEWDVVLTVRSDGELVGELTDRVPCTVRGLGAVEAAGRWLGERGVRR